jgi:hypothetical protein
MNTSYLLASVFWSAIGMGCWVYGKKQGAGVAMFGGLVMIGTTYFIEDVLYMSLVCIVTIAAMCYSIRQG